LDIVEFYSTFFAGSNSSVSMLFLLMQPM